MSDPRTKLPLPAKDDREGTLEQFGLLTDAKREIVEEVIALLRERCDDNPALLSELAEHVNGTIFGNCIHQGIGLSPEQYIHFMMGNVNLRTDIATRRIEEDKQTLVQMADTFQQQAVEMGKKLKLDTEEGS